MMVDHEQASEPDRITELLNQVAATLGGQAVTAEASPVEPSSPHEAAAQPLMNFDQILDSLSPGASQDMRAVEQLVRERLPDIIDRLPRLPKLPSPAEAVEIANSQGGTPILLESPVTVREMANFLRVEGGTTQEVGVQIYGDKYIMIPGAEDETTIPYAWQYVEEYGSVSMHTHPTHDMDHYHYPSVEDLAQAQDADVPQMVLSAEGIILYPGRPEARTVPSLREHSLTLPFIPGGTDIETAHEIKRRNKDQYLDTVAKIDVIPWDALPPDATMRDVADYAARLRQQKYERGELG